MHTYHICNSLLVFSEFYRSIHSIKVLQKCAICVICGANPRFHAQDVANNLKISLFDDFVLYNLCLFMFDAIHGHLSAVFIQLFTIHVVSLLDNIAF